MGGIAYTWLRSMRYSPIFGWLPFNNYSAGDLKLPDISKKKEKSTTGTDATSEEATPIKSAEDSKNASEEPLNLKVTTAESKIINDIKLRFNTGDYIGALEIVDKQSLDAQNGNGSKDYREWIERQMHTLLLSAGWSHLKLGKCEEAVKTLRRAESVKKSPETAKGLAYCYYKLSLFDAADESFEYYLKSNPRDAQMKIFRSENYESLGNYRAAAEALESALVVLESPSDSAVETSEKIDSKEIPKELSDQKDIAKQKEDLRKRLQSMREKEKEGRFQHVVSSNNFVLTYRAVEHEEIGTFALDILEATLFEYIGTFGYANPGTPIEVILYPDGKTFRSIVNEGPSWMSGVFDGRIRVPIEEAKISETATKDLIKKILRHELSHALLSKISDARTFPSWFEEGLAQRVECLPNCPKFQFSAMPGKFLSENDFEQSFTSFEKTKADRAYKQSYYLFLVLEANFGKDVIQRIVSTISMTSDVSSNSLLKPLDISFSDLINRAADRWNKNETIAD